jgi:hypothetical protein
MTPQRQALLLIVFVIGAAPSLVSAQAESPGSAVVTLPGAQAGRSWADQLALELIAETPQLDFITPAQARKRLIQELGSRALAAADRSAAAAHRSLDAFDDLDEAARLHQEASEAHLRLLPLLDTLDEPVRLLIGLATVQLALNQDEGVRATLDRALRLDPSLDLDPQEVSPRLVTNVQQARLRMQGRPLLTAEQARELLRQLRVDRLIVLQPRPDHRQTLVERYDVESADRVDTWTIQRRDISVVAAALAAGSTRERSTTTNLDPAFVEPAPDTAPTEAPDDIVRFEPAEPTTPPPQRRPFYRSWWFWTIVGAVVVGGGATGVVFGLQAGETNNDLTLEVRRHW